ncbi:hypothetical protein [Trinickia mobilis]|uniref:hypothetical protein n=1 Tax=Trinickia mobilis TaxID=2816356 RepID=UPI001A8D3714|nr:hypothetical protein [Trinickia mobilis]
MSNSSPTLDDALLAVLIQRAAHDLPFNNRAGSEARARTLSLLLATVSGSLGVLEFSQSAHALEIVLFGPPSIGSPFAAS